MKRVIFGLLLAVSQTLPALAQPMADQLTVGVSHHAEASAVRLDYNCSAFQPQLLTRGAETRLNFNVEGEGTTYERSRPMLPMVSRMVIVPGQVGLALDVDEGSVRRYVPDYPIAECDDDEMPAAVASMGDLYPEKFAEMSDPVIVRGVRMVKVTVYPVQYDNRTGEVVVRSHVQARVRFTNDAPVNPSNVGQLKHRSKDFLKYLDAMAINPEVVRRDGPDDVSSYAGYYVVASHRDALLWHRPFIEWRRRAGYKVEILDIAAGDAQNPGTVKTAIRNRYNALLDAGEEPFDHLLLIGDRSSYDGVTAGPDKVLQAEAGNTIWGGAQHADYLMACMDGQNDTWPDMAFSRFTSGSSGVAGLVVGRLLSYEMNPSMQNTDWFNNTAVYSQHWGNGVETAWHITIHTNVRWGEEVLKHLGFSSVHFYEDVNWDQGGGAVGPFIRDRFNEGASVMIGRAENYYWRNGFGGVNDRTYGFPVDIRVSGHGEWTGWNMFRTGDSQHLKGPCTATHGWGGPPTASNSFVWLQMVNGCLLKDMTLGWARTFAITSIEKFMPDFNTPTGGQPMWLHVKTDIDMQGDPAIQPWIGVPRVLSAAVPRAISPETKGITVQVTDPADNSPVEGARVTLYAPGSIPDNDAHNYAVYANIIQQTYLTDADGYVRFALEAGEAFTNNTHVYLTVTGRDIKPILNDITVGAVASAMDINDWSLTEVTGNHDDAVNPGEVFDLRIRAKNIGNANAIAGVSAVVSSTSPWVTVDQNNIWYGDLNAGAGADGDGTARIHISNAAPDADARASQRPLLAVDFSSGQTGWTSGIRLAPVAPCYDIVRFFPSDTISFRQANFDIDIKNVGGVAGGAITARLVSRGIGVSILRDQASYPSIQVNGHTRIQGNQFNLVGTELAIPGSRNQMWLVLTDDAGFVDTVAFDLVVGTPRTNSPVGPDKFGYLCFDDTDTSWSIHPHYRWLEINPDDQNAEYEGTELNFDGNSPDQIGECRVIPLGFRTQFYGKMIDTITVALNGFICMGNQPRITNFQNWPMDQAVAGGMGMLAPLWDDWRLGAGSGVFWAADPDSGRFIIQWHRLRLSNNNNTEETFQVILFDHDQWPSVSGDQMIMFQYKTFNEASNIRNGDEQWVENVPYASTGISSVDGTTGINYYYNQAYASAAAPLQARRALLFATAPDFKAAVLYGWVNDLASGLPIPGATVYTQHGLSAITDADGYWRIGRALAEVDFYITARHDGWNDVRQDGFNVPQDDSVEIDFSLPHPEFTPSTESFSSIMAPNDSTAESLMITNTGNGPLTWRAEKRLIGDANAAPWEKRRRVHVGDSVRCDRMEGVAYANGEIFMAGSRSSGNNWVWKFDSTGARVDSFRQCGGAPRGFKDLEYDGENLWGAGENTTWCFTTTGDTVKHWAVQQLNPTYNIAYDSENERLWLSGLTSRIFNVDRDGNVIGSLANNGIRLSGLGYWPEDPNGYDLYITSAVGNNLVKFYKMNTTTNDTLLVHTVIDTAVNVAGTGCFITNQWDVYSWVLMTIRTNTNAQGFEKVDIFQLDARRDWFNLDTWSGTIQPNEFQELNLIFDTHGLPAVTFRGELVFSHNADGARTIIPVELDVEEGAGNQAVRSLRMANGWNTVSLNVTPNQTDVPTMFAPLARAGTLRMVKDGLGHFYRPSDGFNNMPNWDASNGYLVDVIGDNILPVRGAVIGADLPIHLDAGWSLKAYYPRVSVDPRIGVEGAAGNLKVVKDGGGRFYMPGYNFCNMSQMTEGQGYYFKALRGCDLIYGAPRGRDDGGEELLVNPPIHFTFTERDGFDNHSLLLIGSASMAGWEAGVFDGTILVGSGTFDGSGKCGLSIWGDNPATTEIDGASTSDLLQIKLWDGTAESMANVTMQEGSLSFANGGLAVATVSEPIAPVEFGIASAYPNPFNGRTTITCGVTESGVARVSIFDLQGREVARLLDGYTTAGNHRLVWNADRVPTGLYVIRLESAGESSVRKVMLLK